MLHVLDNCPEITPNQIKSILLNEEEGKTRREGSSSRGEEEMILKERRDFERERENERGTKEFLKVREEIFDEGRKMYRSESFYSSRRKKRNEETSSSFNAEEEEKKEKKERWFEVKREKNRLVFLFLPLRFEKKKEKRDKEGLVRGSIRVEQKREDGRA